MKHCFAIGILGCALVLTGCVSPYIPSPDRPFEAIPEFRTRNSLSIVNAQSSTELVSIGNKMLANYKEWTDVAIQITRRELEKRGASINPAAPRTLRLAIMRADQSTGWVWIETEIDLRVETGDGYVATYTGKNRSAMAGFPHRQVDGTMMRVVVEMLKDPTIVRYLTR